MKTIERLADRTWTKRIRAPRVAAPNYNTGNVYIYSVASDGSSRGTGPSRRAAGAAAAGGAGRTAGARMAIDQ